MRRTSVRPAPSAGGLKSALPEPPDEAPDVPGFHTWAAVYWFAFGTFVAVVAALTVFSRVYA